MGVAFGPGRIAKIFGAYPLSAYNNSRNLRASAIMSDAFVEPPGNDCFIGQCGTLRDARAVRDAAQAPVWVYQMRALGSHSFVGHGDEMPYIFQPQNYSFPKERWNRGSDDARLADIIGSYWTNFVKFQNPNGEGLESKGALPFWPHLEGAQPEGERLLSVDAHGLGAQPASRLAQCAFWQHLLSELPEDVEHDAAHVNPVLIV